MEQEISRNSLFHKNTNDAKDAHSREDVDCRKVTARGAVKNIAYKKKGQMISHFFTRPFYIESAAQKRKDLREFRLMLIFPRG